MELTDYGITVIRNKIFPSNTYILKDELSDDCLVIDPGLDQALIEKTLNDSKLTPAAVLVTHAHFDHIGSVSFIKNKYHIPYFLHEADIKLSKSANFYLKMASINSTISIAVPDKLFSGFHEHLSIKNFDLNIYNYPGHSNGSCIIRYKKILFSGDILYKYGLGFNNFPGEDKPKLKNSILDIFKNFTDDSLVLPGHGDAEFLGKIKNNNVDLLNFIKD